MTRPTKLSTVRELLDVRYLRGANNARSSFGFVRTLLGGRRAARTLCDVCNYRRISPTLATSGQPTEAQFALIRDAGFRTVINLAPHRAENAIADESGVLERLGLRYVHIPVDFRAPSEADYRAFCEAMRSVGSEPVWVHCAANMRVSAFVYRYRVRELGVGVDVARADLEAIWDPFGAWEIFIRS